MPPGARPWTTALRPDPRDQSDEGEAWQLVLAGMGLRHPKGIPAVAELHVGLVSRKDYVYRLFERQCEIGLQNLEKIHAAVGERVTAINVTGTDFGAQDGPFNVA